MRTVILASALAALVACANKTKNAEPPADASKSAANAGVAPAPFTAAQIREATQQGRTYRFKTEMLGQPPHTQQIEFIAVSPTGCTTKNQRFDLEGKPVGGAGVAQATWDDLVKHAAYPAASTSISDEPCETPAGKFSCKIYVVRTQDNGVKLVRKVWFAKSLPGAPVKTVVERGGAVVMRMTLQSHTPGAAAAPRAVTGR